MCTCNKNGDSIVAKYVNQVREKIKELENINKRLTGNIDGLLFAYRGEEMDFGESRLTPSIFRNNGFVQKEVSLFEKLEDYNVVNSDRYIDKMIDAQHYVAVSRSLDITFNVLVALYFACYQSPGNEQKYEDGALYVFCFPNYVSPHSLQIEELYQIILGKKEGKILDKNFKVISHAMNNDRIIAQNGGFIFFPGKKKYMISDVYYEKILINQDDKKAILDELDILFGINKAKIFPEKELVAKYVKEQWIKSNECFMKDHKIENQIDEFVDRLKYELKLRFEKERIKRPDQENEIRINNLRIIRKEFDDLKVFVNNVEDNKKREELTIKVKKICDKMRRSQDEQ